MNTYEIYTVTESGTIVPSTFSIRAHKMSHVELELNRLIKKIGKPCVIVISKNT